MTEAAAASARLLAAVAASGVVYWDVRDYTALLPANAGALAYHGASTPPLAPERVANAPSDMAPASPYSLATDSARDWCVLSSWRPLCTPASLSSRARVPSYEEVPCSISPPSPPSRSSSPPATVPSSSFAAVASILGGCPIILFCCGLSADPPSLAHLSSLS